MSDLKQIIQSRWWWLLVAVLWVVGIGLNLTPQPYTVVGGIESAIVVFGTLVIVVAKLAVWAGTRHGKKVH